MIVQLISWWKKIPESESRLVLLFVPSTVILVAAVSIIRNFLPWEITHNLFVFIVTFFAVFFWWPLGWGIFACRYKKRTSKRENIV